MFSHEINEIMTKRQYNIGKSDYFNICDTSPQISHVHYDAYSNRYHIHTDDGYHWEFAVCKD